jgi:hypothetical protein
MSAPEGRTKLNAVPTQIQYFVVALARRIDVSIHAAEATIEALQQVNAEVVRRACDMLMHVCLPERARDPKEWPRLTFYRAGAFLLLLAS